MALGRSIMMHIVRGSSHVHLTNIVSFIDKFIRPQSDQGNSLAKLQTAQCIARINNAFAGDQSIQMEFAEEVRRLHYYRGFLPDGVRFNIQSQLDVDGPVNIWHDPAQNMAPPAPSNSEMAKLGGYKRYGRRQLTATRSWKYGRKLGQGGFGKAYLLVKLDQNQNIRDVSGVTMHYLVDSTNIFD